MRLVLLAALRRVMPIKKAMHGMIKKAELLAERSSLCAPIKQGERKKKIQNIGNMNIHNGESAISAADRHRYQSPSHRSGPDRAIYGHGAS